MNRLFTILWLKVKSYPTFWILFGLHILLLITVIFGIEPIANTLSGETDVTIEGQTMKAGEIMNFDLYTYPQVWYKITYWASVFKYISAFIIIVLVSNDYSYRMLRQSIISGMSRLEYIGTQLIAMVLLALVSALTVGICILIVGRQPEAEEISMAANSSFLFGYFSELLCYMGLAFLVTMLIKRAGVTIMILLVYSFVAEPVLSFIFRDSIGMYLPKMAITGIIPSPVQALMEHTEITALDSTNTILSYVYFLLFMGFSYMLLAKRDL